MVSVSGIAMLLLLVAVTHCQAQRPGFAPNPWDHMYTQSSESTTRAPQVAGGTQNGNNGLVDRFGNENTDGVTFRYFNNVPIQGPDAPCIGCNYRLTNKGFIRLNNNLAANNF